ncbi:hypothetical protein EZ428_13980 [Pedobacter frigiditerrae]|uniref:Lipoprotein n=1 Tax=Pedobacter frigiditerrae TaxID=2530452 RepID=A0A4R0MTL6_9SPHI|nr:hypothetical protein [Pedobacter frigiditerrae]TCC90380.1 hypothetical protein EZ428_13980 [Pedobacter frigiditerrae]
MKKQYLFYFIILLSFFGCKRDNKNIRVCNGRSIDELAWFQKIKDGTADCKFYEGTTVKLYQYKGEMVFYVWNGLSSLSVCNRLVYNCAGNIISSSWTDSDWVAFNAFTDANVGQLLYTKPKS